MKRQILLWVMRRALTNTVTPEATPPALGLSAIGLAIGTVAVGTVVGGTLMFTTGVLLVTMFTGLLQGGMMASNALLLTVLASALVAGAVGVSICALVRHLTPKPMQSVKTGIEDAFDTAAGAARDFGGIALDIIQSFIEGLEDGKPTKKRRTHFEIDPENLPRATVVPIRRRQH